MHFERYIEQYFKKLIMIKNETCKMCGSDKIIQGVKMLDFGHANIKRSLSLEVDKSKGFFHKNIEKKQLHISESFHINNVCCIVIIVERIVNASSKGICSCNSAAF